jgi:selenide,water dikinase
MFDAQTSGGLVLAVPPDLLERARALLLAGGDLAAVVGRVRPAAGAKGRLYLR